LPRKELAFQLKINYSVMNPKYRYLYVLVGGIGFVFLFYYAISNFTDIDPARILAIAVPDMLFFFLAYKTYPPEPLTKRQESYHHRKVSNY
jgi:hypothetical protein